MTISFKYKLPTKECKYDNTTDNLLESLFYLVDKYVRHIF